jgi:hypothetical protein
MFVLLHHEEWLVLVMFSTDFSYYKYKTCTKMLYYNVLDSLVTQKYAIKYNKISRRLVYVK